MSEFPIDAVQPIGESGFTPAYVRIAEELRRVVQQRGLSAGTKLPSETELVSRFGVARMTVREGIRVLRAEGLVRAEQGRGVFVADSRGGRAVQMGQRTESNQPAWREGIRSAIAAGRFTAQEADRSGWPDSALRAAGGVIASLTLSLEDQPGRVEQVELFVKGAIDGAAERVIKGLDLAETWVVSVTGGGDKSQHVTRLGLDQAREPIVAAVGMRAASWPVTSTEQVEP